MVRKRELVLWGKILGLAGGIFFALGAGLLFLDFFLKNRLILGPIGEGLIVKTLMFGVNIDVLFLAIISVVLGTVVIVTVSAEPKPLVAGIILIVIGVFGLGIPGFITVVGGIIYIIASTRNR